LLLEFKFSRVGVFAGDLHEGVWIGWLDLFTPYSRNSGLQAIQLYRCFHTLQFTVTHTLGFSVFTSRIMATDFNTVIISVSLYLQHTWSLLVTAQFLSCHYSAATNSEDSTQFNSSVPKLISRYSGVSKHNSSLYFMLLNTCLWSLCTDHAENTTYVKEACLLIRCLAVDVLLLRALTPLGNVFTGSLPSNGSMRHNILIPYKTVANCSRVTWNWWCFPFPCLYVESVCSFILNWLHLMAFLFT
jgi:hypothetical protein